MKEIARGTRRVRYSVKRAERPLDKLRESDALEMTSSAIAYDLAAGLKVEWANDGDTLLIKIHQANGVIENKITRFVPIEAQT